MNLESGDYVIFTEGQNEKGKHKYHLMKVTGVDGKKVRGILEKNSHLKNLRQTAETSKKDIVLNLGPNPRPGNVYGQDVAKLFRSRATHDDFGTIYFFYDIEDKAKVQLMAAFSKVHKFLSQQKLDFLVDPSTTIWEVHAFNGEKYAGTYKQSRDTEKHPSVAMIRPDSVPSHDLLDYVLKHELAHHVDFHYLHRTPDARKLRARWVSKFKESIAPETVTREECKRLRDALFDQEDPPSAFAGQLEEDDARKFKLIIGWYSQVYSLTRKELDILWDGDYRDDIKDIWPSRVSKKGVAPVISEYSTKNPAEFFAECLSFYWTKKKLPKDITKLVEKTLSFVKSVREK